jgi:VIT1/CCC1 family predicted Fe2+/Mn2+ transporter
MKPLPDAPPEQHLTSSAMLQDIIIGLSDGLTVPFALAAGLSGAVQSSGLVITAGLAEIVAGSIAMGLGGYLAGRTEVDHYAAELAREHERSAHRARHRAPGGAGITARNGPF